MRRLLTAALALVLAGGCERNKNAEPQSSSSAAKFPSNAAADSLLSLGESVYKRSEYDSATALLGEGRQFALAAGDSSSVARADTWLGLTSMKQGRNENARQLGEQALAMKLRLGLKKDLFRSYNALGLLAWLEGRFADAQGLFGNARASAEAVHDTISVAKAIGNLGLVHSDVGEFEKARNEFAALANAAHQRNDTMPEANAFSNLGMVDIRDGDPGAAIGWLEKARTLYRTISYPGGEESVLGQLGSAYATLGQPQRAIAYVDSAMAVARSHQMVREESEDLQIYAELMGEAGDHQAALRHLARSRILSNSAGLASRGGDIARAQARELAAVSRNDLALSRALEATAIHKKAGAAFEAMKDHLLVAEIAQTSHHAEQARQELAQASEIAGVLSVAVAKENISLGSARVADIAGDPASTLRALPADLTFSRMGPEAAGEAEALRARAFARLRQWPDAVTSGRKAVASLNRVRESIGEGPLRAAYTGDRADVYADLVVALLHLGRTADAFDIADAARGKSLLEHLTAMRGAVRSTSKDLSDADRLLRRIDYLTERLRIADTLKPQSRSVALRNDLQDLAARLASARSAYEDRMKTIAHVDPRGSALLGASQVSIRDVQKSVRPGEVMIEYFATQHQLFVFVATGDTVIATSSPTDLDDLANRVRLASDLLSRSKSASEGRSVMRGLYDALILPIEGLPEVKASTTFIIIPHSALAYLPFAALIAENGRRLVESRGVLTLPSASSLAVLRAERNQASGPAISVFAPFPDELVGTRAEATAVRRETMGTAVYMGARATEAQLREALALGGNVHIASHAMVNQTNPMFSHIELSPGKKANPDDDGSLDVHELLRIPVRSELVYLSGCETGVGAAWSTSFRRSQDYATLSQAILYAGAQNVVATLWRIDDLGASVFAQKFYAALATRNPVDGLATAQRMMIRDPRYSSPRYWAGYTISGAGVLREYSQKTSMLSVKSQ
ncbi:MAG: CHAT domain-containing protein [Gemmatimonadales bacterium]